MELRALVAFATFTLAPAPGSIFFCADVVQAEALISAGFAEKVAATPDPVVAARKPNPKKS